MNVEVKELKSEMMKEYVVTANQKDWADAQKNVKTEIAKTITIKGFRQGQAPKELVDARIQDVIVIDEAIKMYGPKMIEETIKNEKDIVKASPKVEIQKKTKDELIVKFTFFKKPDIKLPDWNSIKAETGEIKANDNEVELELKALQNRFAKPSKKEGAAEIGDIAVIDFVGYQDGKTFKGGEAKKHPLELGSNSFIPGFEQQLVGIKAGEKREVKVTFPKDYPSAQLADKEVIFKCECISVESKILPEINDKFVKGLKVGFLQTKEELLKNIKAHIEQAKAMAIRRKNEEKIVKLISEKAEVKIPKKWVDSETQRLKTDFEQKLAMQGMTIADYSEKTNSNEEKILKELNIDAKNRLKTQIVLADVREQAKIIVEPETAKLELTNAAKAMNKPYEEIEKQVGGLQGFRTNLETKKIFDFISTKLG